MITTFLFSGYSLAFSIVFLKYLQRFIQDQTTDNSDKASWIVLILASLLWPISLPMSGLEQKVKKTQSQIDLIYFDYGYQTYSELVSEKIEQEKVKV